MSCNLSECPSPACIVKNLFVATGLSSVIRLNQIDLQFIYRHVDQNYQGVVIENTVDAIQLLFHAFSKIKASCCRTKAFLELFELKYTEKYTCECGERLLSQASDNVYYVPIDIKDYKVMINPKKLDSNLNSNLFNIFKTHTKTQTYKLCKRPKCTYQASKKAYNLSSYPNYLIFKLNWSLQGHIIAKHSISTTFLTKDIFECEKAVTYDLVFVSVNFFEENYVFYLENSVWYSDNRDECGFEGLINKIINNQYSVEVLIYKKSENRPSTSLSSIRPFFSENLRDKGGKYKEQEKLWTCKQCKTVNSRSDQFCIKCSGHYSNGQGWLCIRCQNLNSNSDLHCPTCDKNVKASLTTSIKTCKKCNGILKTDSFCPKCSENFIETGSKSTTSIILPKKVLITRPYSNFCKDCSSALISPNYCSLCLSRCLVNSCKTCNESKRLCENCAQKYCKICKKKTLEHGSCKNCGDRNRSKSSKNKAVCCQCKSMITDNDLKNCSQCLKNSLRDSYCTYCGSKIYNHICTACIKKNKNSNY